MTGVRTAMKKTKSFDLWVWISIGIMGLYLLFMVYPIVNMSLQSFFDSKTGDFTMENYVKFFSDNYYFSTLFNSFKLSILVTFFSLLLGVPLAYFYNIYQMRGRSVLQILIILCSMSAPFIGAYSWILLLGRGGVITKFMKTVMGITPPNIYGLSGCVFVLTLKLFPLVFLYVSGAMKNVDNSLLEASYNLGCSGFKRLCKVVIPLCSPSILAAGLMVFMRALADFGTPLLIGEGYRTFPVEIYKQFVGETSVNHNFAAAISVTAILMTALVFILQKVAANKLNFTMNALHPIEARKPKPLTGVLIHIYAYLLVALSLLPQVYVIYLSFCNTSLTGNMFKPGYSLNSYNQIFTDMGDMVVNTIVICGSALLIILVLAVMIAYLVVRRRNVMNNVIDTFSMIPYIIPGSVIGIALIISFNNGILVLTGTALIMVIAMVIRRIPYTIRSSVAVLQQIPMSVEEAASSLGASKLKTFGIITVPMMMNGIIAGAIMSWVTLVTELSSSILLYSSKTITLNLGVYIMVSRGADGKACAISTIITLFTIISLLIVNKLTGGKEVTM